MKKLTALLQLLIACVFFSSSPSFASEAITSQALDNVIAIYGQAWHEKDDAQREKLLTQVWANQGTYKDPSVSVSGKKALLTHIAAFVKQYPHAKFVMHSKIDHYSNQFRFGWKLRFNDGVSADVEGFDFGELDETGKIVKIVGFFGALPIGLQAEEKLNLKNPS